MATKPLEICRTVNFEWYTNICLPEVFEKIRINNLRKYRIILHHDNASSHKSIPTDQYLCGQNEELVDHPPQTPDLKPYDFLRSLPWRIYYEVNDFRARRSDWCVQHVLDIELIPLTRISPEKLCYSCYKYSKNIVCSMYLE